MALSFLDSVNPLVSLIAGIQGRNRANKAVTAGNVPTAAETQSNAIYQALLHPDSPLMQSASEQDRARNLADFQQQLTEMQLADRRAQSMGHAPTFFQPERADEAISYLTSRGLPQVNAMSQQQTNQRLLQAASGISGQVGPQQQRLNTTRQQGVSNASYGSQVPNQIMSILQGLSGPSASSTPSAPTAQKQYPYTPAPPQYNQMRYPYNG